MLSKNITEGWDFFKNPGMKLAKKFLTITPRGGFLFSSGFVHEEKLTQYTHCTLAYNDYSRSIGFSFTDDRRVEGAIKITHRNSKNSSIQSGSFFMYYKLNPLELAGRYETEKLNLSRRGQLYIINLDKRMPVKRQKV